MSITAALIMGGASLAAAGGSALYANSQKVAQTDGSFKSAELIREQFDDWQNTYMPIELEALKGISFNNDTLLPNALDKARKTVSDSYGSMGGILERQNRGLGIVPTTQQEATSKRLLNLNEAATTASVQNKTRANVRQMDDQILMGTTPNPNIVR